jgi:hypothetical protein
MRILEIRPHRAGGKTIARFDAELDHGIKAYDLKLVQGDAGLRVYGPALHGGAAVTFPAIIASQLAILALEAIAHHGPYPLRCA